MGGVCVGEVNECEMKKSLFFIVAVLFFQVLRAQSSLDSLRMSALKSVEIKFPLGISGWEDYQPYAISRNSRYIVVRKLLDEELFSFFVFDLFNEKVIFSHDSVEDVFFVDTGLVYKDFEKNLLKYSLNSGRISIVSPRVSECGSINGVVYFVRDDYLFYESNLSDSVYVKNHCFVLNTENFVLNFSEGELTIIDSLLNHEKIEIPSLTKSSKGILLNDSLLLYTSNSDYVLYDVRNKLQKFKMNYKLLGMDNPREVSKIDPISFLIFNDAICIKSYYGFTKISLKEIDSVGLKIEVKDFDNFFYSASNNYFLVEGVRDSQHLHVTTNKGTDFRVFIDSNLIDYQLNGIVSVNDSMFLILFRWTNAILINLNGGAIVNSGIPSSGKLTPDICFLKINSSRYFYVSNNGCFIYDSRDNESEPVGIRLKNIRNVYVSGNEIVFCEFYDWMGPSSPEDLKAVYYVDPKTISVVKVEEFEVGESNGAERIELFDNNRSYKKFEVEEFIFQFERNDIKFQMAIDDERNLVVSDGLHYVVSKSLVKHFRFFSSDRIVSFDQLDPVYNRPDIVLDSIGKYFGGADEDLVANYRAAWEKRIERLGLDKGKLSTGEIAVPNAEIVNADEIKYEDKDGSVVIHVKANDPKYTLRRYNVLVNEVPVYGADGISIAALNTQSWERTDTIALSMGNNKIQVSVMNELGLENFKYPMYVNYTPEEIISSKTYYVGIGVNHFKDASHDLKYCVKDVQDLAQAFAKHQTQIDTLVFTDGEVTKENILALKSYLQEHTTVNDKVIISCSSHGLLDDSLNFYLATYDVDFSHPKVRGLKYEELEGLLDGIPARQKLLLLDACNSGENERMYLQNNSSDQMAQAGMKGVDVEIVNDEINTFHQMTEMFVNVRNNTGSVIIAASGGMQSAQEGRVVNGMKIENGAFTYSVLEYLAKEITDQDRCTVNGMKNYVERRVEEITNGEQKPTSRQETMEVDWIIK